MSAEKNFELKLILFQFLIVLIFGFTIWNSMFSLSPGLSDQMKVLKRSPASASQALPEKEKTELTFDLNKLSKAEKNLFDESTLKQNVTDQGPIFQIHCNQGALTLDKESKSSFIQIHGLRCGPVGKVHDEVFIVNETNGFIASLFALHADKYQTDLIQLKQGINEIKIKFRTYKNKFTEKILRVNYRH